LISLQENYIVHCPPFEVCLTSGKSEVMKHNLLNPLD